MRAIQLFSILLLLGAAFSVNVEIHVSDTNNDGSNMVVGISDGYQWTYDRNSFGPAEDDFTGAFAYSFNPVIPSQTAIPVDITPLSSPTYVYLSDDQVSSTIPLPFEVNLFGRPTNYIRISSNGFIFAGENHVYSTSSGCCSGQDLRYQSTTTGPDYLIAGVWNDLYPPGNGDISYGVEGIAPNRVFIVDFDDVSNCCDSEGGYTFQIKLFENGTTAPEDVGYYYTEEDQGDDDDSTSKDRLSVDLDSSCDGNVVTVTSKGDPLSSAKVTVSETLGGPIASGNTDSDGEFEFAGCGMDVTIYANKGGYLPDTEMTSLVSCASCEEEPEVEPEPEPEVGPEPEPEPQPESGPECVVDGDCASTHYCTAGGDCMPVTGCGDVVDHALVPYDCGDEDSCPECKSGYTCVDHVCKANIVKGEDGFVGDNRTIDVILGDEPCRGCDIQITGPDGKTYTGKSDENGQFVLPLSLEGTYKIALMDENGDVSAETTVKSLPKPAPQEPEKPTETSDDGLSLLFLLILLALVLGGVLYWRGKGKKK
jgi:hypothetical protein